MSPWLLGGGAVVALWALTRSSSRGGPMAPGEWLPSTPPNARQLRIWQAIRRNAYGAVPHVTVTSGTRTHRQQAQAMRKKVELYGRSSLDIYSSRVRDAMWAAPDTLDGWTAAVEQLAAAGVIVSRHHAGQALDLRIRDLTATQREALQKAAQRAVGVTGRTLMEQDHLHLQW